MTLYAFAIAFVLVLCVLIAVGALVDWLTPTVEAVRAEQDAQQAADFNEPTRSDIEQAMRIANGHGGVGGAA